MGRYVNVGQIEALLPTLFSTAGLTPGQTEFFIETVEDEIDARIGRYWPTATFSGNAPPIVKTLAKLGTSVAIRTSLINMEDPSVSQWIKGDQDRYDNLVDKLVAGTADMVTGSGTIIERQSPKSVQFWSSTKNYVPTRSVIDPIDQQVSPTRIQDTQDAIDADTA